jgi:cell division protein FtsI/penicillin-binding protein 2
MGVMSRRKIITSVVAGIAVVSVGAGGFAYLQHREQVRLDSEARATADRFASAWSNREVNAIAYAGQPAGQVAAGFKTATSGLGKAPVKVTVSSLTRDGDKATGTLSVAWTLAQGSAWSYKMPISLQHGDAQGGNAAGSGSDGWAVVAREGATMWAPGVSPDAKLVAARTWGQRGDVKDRNGAPILEVGDVFDVAIDPTRATAESITALESVVEGTPGSLVAKLNAAKASGSNAAIPVIAYRQDDFRARKAALDALVGVVYPPRQQPLAPSRTFAQPLLGGYGAVTAETVKNGKGRYVAGDYAGLSGLQGKYDSVLAGTPGLKVTASDKPDVPLFEKPAVPGTPVTLTLDRKTQAAAEAALPEVPSALVAVDVKTGELLAVANSPELGFDRALGGKFPPGSTLKVATTYSLLGKGLSPSTVVPCLATSNVGGLKVRNYEGEVLGQVPFSEDFAHSCNTAFVGLAAGRLGNSDIHDAAKALGVGADWAKHLGVPGAFAGSVPVSDSTGQRAMAGLGQANTEASPASLAVMAASVARGTYIEPALIRTPVVPGADRTPKPLNPKVVGQLQQLMSQVVTSGTATKAMTGVAGGPVYGKTGTAEFGTQTPLQTRAWFIGWQGKVAFAVLVEEGKSGAEVAAPIAKTFLNNLNG